MFTGYNREHPETLKKKFGGFSAAGFIVSTQAMHPPDPCDPLSRTLASWRVSPPSDPNFRPLVWQRIRSRSSWGGYVRAHLVGWSVAAAFAVVAAGWTGHTVAQANLDARREQMVVSYLGNLDPRVLAKLRP